MPDLRDGETAEVKGSAAKPYVLKNIGGVYSCSCPAWRNQSLAIEKRTCKHLRKYRGEEAERLRVGGDAPPKTGSQGKEKKEKKVGPELLLAQPWTNDAQLDGWWMSEKLDGVRAYWDGKQLLSRLGNVLHAPDWFLASLPETPLDGELWLGRKAFQRTVSIVRRQDKSDHWRQVQYVVFDAPRADDVFEDRLRLLTELLAGCEAHLRLLEQQVCRDISHLGEELARVEALGGEGLMLRQPGSRYEAGRSSTLLKVKTFHDAEARVVGHQPGKGRHKGRLGALVAELPDGTEFSVGTGFSDVQRESPPAIGSQITFRYQELSDGGVPRFPSFVRAAEGTTSGDAAPIATDPPVASKKKTAAKTSSPKAAKPKTTAKPKAAKKSKTTTKPKPAANPATTGLRYFEFIDGKSQKFWEINSAGCDVTVRYGRIGAQGASRTKSFSDAAAALKHVEKLIAEKTGKGYVETASPA